MSIAISLDLSLQRQSGGGQLPYQHLITGQYPFTKNNLLKSSEDMNTTWGKNGHATTNGFPDPFGGLGAVKTVPDTPSTNHNTTQQPSVFIANQVYTASAYFKMDSHRYVTLSLHNATDSHWARATLDLQTGTILSGGAVAPVGTVGVTNVGDGWYRLFITGAPTVISPVSTLYIYSATATAIAGGAGVFNGTDFFYVYGPQLTEGTQPLTYTRTVLSQPLHSIVGKNMLKYTEQMDNAAWTKSNTTIVANVTMGPLDTNPNLFRYSKEFDNALWSKTRATVTPNAIAAPDGTTTADKLVEDNTATNSHYIFRGINTQQSQTYTVSIYAKAGERDTLLIQDGGVSYISSTFTLTGGGTAVSTFGTSSITSVGNGWYRCVATGIAPTTVLSNIVFALGNPANVYTGDGTSGLHIWGAQAEEGASATTLQHVHQQIGPSADRIVESTDGAPQTHVILQSLTRPNRIGTFTASAYFKKGIAPGDLSFARLLFYGASSADAIIATVNLTTGALVGAVLATGTATNGSGTVTSAGNGWHKVTITGTLAAGTTMTVRVDCHNGSLVTYQGAGTAGFYVAHLQLSESAQALNYERTLDLAATYDDQNRLGYHGFLGTTTGSDSGDPGWRTHRIKFDGVDDMINMPFHLIDYDTYTAVAIAKSPPAATAASNTIFNHEFTGAATRRAGLYFPPTNPNQYLMLYYSDGITTYSAGSGAGSWAYDTWAMCSMVLDKRNINSSRGVLHHNGVRYETTTLVSPNTDILLQQVPLLHRVGFRTSNPNSSEIAYYVIFPNVLLTNAELDQVYQTLKAIKAAEGIII